MAADNGFLISAIGICMTLAYVLITAAHNEEKYIEKTLRSVLAQTVKPLKWIIVNDGSTDRTEAIVRAYCRNRKWIELYNLPPRQGRDFAGKAAAFNSGRERARNICFDLIGNLDADISFGTDYFEYLIARFQEAPRLGVAGTHYIENEFHSFRDSYINVEHVNGQCQLFRRQCIEEIGGYLPIKAGGIDWVAVTTARMKGWKTHSFGGRVFTHHRPMGTAGANVYASRYKYGRKDFFLGNHLFWEFFRVSYQLGKKPYVLGGLCLLAGYLWAWLSGAQKPISAELIKFHRSEQLQRLRQLLQNKMKLSR